ncbi:hypothetical protein [Desulfitobacterium hafniense]|uniref:hypothetical protein n=1 Tax=Desulfitobacterium hafniense TaxID=49338 RepID=UPI001AEBC10E|nr:hypothetical protein [Desulfitobacterium hafniense]
MNFKKESLRWIIALKPLIAAFVLQSKGKPLKLPMPLKLFRSCGQRHTQMDFSSN